MDKKWWDQPADEQFQRFLDSEDFQKHLQGIKIDYDTVMRIHNATRGDLEAKPARVIDTIRAEMDSGAVNERVIFMLARFNHEDMEHYRPAIEEQLKEAARKQNKKSSHSRPVFDAKQPWQEHVRRCLSDGVEIRSIKAIKDYAGADKQPWQGIPDSTLKSWAKETDPSIEFKKGRPKQNK